MQKRPSVKIKKELAYEYINQKIIDGTFEPGDRIVIDHIARELNLSTIPVREAIQQLEADGLIEIIPYSGAVVQLVNDAEYQEAMYVLAILEGAAAALAAKSLSLQEFNELEALNHEAEVALYNFDFETFTRVNRNFHDTINSKCGNVYLVERIKQAFQRISQVVRAGFSFVPQRAKESISEHNELLKLIKESAPEEKIEKFARQHTLNMAEAVHSRNRKLKK